MVPTERRCQAKNGLPYRLPWFTFIPRADHLSRPLVFIPPFCDAKISRRSIPHRENDSMPLLRRILGSSSRKVHRRLRRIAVESLESRNLLAPFTPGNFVA